jgi:hypothetical protein
LGVNSKTNGSYLGHSLFAAPIAKPIAAAKLLAASS